MNLVEAAEFTREWQIFVGPMRSQIAQLLVILGEPITLPDEWIDISHKVTQPPTINEWQEENIYDWSASLAGRHYNAELMPPDASVLIKARLLTPFYQGPWQVAALGYVRQWKVTGDKDGERAWQATVDSVRTYIDQFHIDARQYGKRNIAEGASVTASGTLANAELEAAEFGGGGIREITPSNLTDRDINTVWISDIAPI